LKKEGNVFSSLEALRSQLPEGVRKPTPEPPGPARAVVRMERKGRRGKEVTVVEQLGLPSSELQRWCGELKKEMGCGGCVEDAAVVLQGDHRDRLPKALAARGVKKISVG
jgi:translation initiation factor 1